jgi:hypothetical protein
VFSQAEILSYLSRTKMLDWRAGPGAVNTGSGNGALNGPYALVGTGSTSGSTSRVNQQSDSYTILQRDHAAGSVSQTITTALPFVWQVPAIITGTTTNGIFRVGWGKSSSTAGAGDWTTAGFGWVIRNLDIYGFYHDGTNYVETDTNINAGVQRVLDLMIRRTATAFEFYVNGVLGLTSTVTGFAITAASNIRAEAENGADSAVVQVRMGPTTFVDLS